MKTYRMCQATTITLTLALIVVLVGCNSTLHGTWKTDPVPKGEAFYIIEAQFKDDGTYRATAKKGDEVVKLAGTYDFNGMKLVLKSPGKPERKYGAAYVLGGSLKLTHEDKKLTMKKQ